jgi:hypothetical protein
VLIEYPMGAIIDLESFQQQSAFDKNRIWLEWTDAKTKMLRKLEQDPNRQETLNSSTGTKIRFHFVPGEKALLPPAGADVTLHYRTPNRVAAFTVPFDFRDLPLP